ncbi:MULTISPECIES: cytochrome c biogenesis heme-transporting ATPase CcmA [Methylocaldum]|jgi:heme exporter protein A|uniref:cytochrome c biogenesis heme-transporting ATPase CcmA n=1 Tax=unclassified Methylocaldum TaxID=2622260 RepID=UPI000A329602|nr:cytochrome c biogenesis heme-transporting ATPase CcmA [Methylocaldum sp. RMAD-M]MBP1152455.1 heme exporter protein A [Methylocaldum sp. RMAD-M]MDV3241025.1 cytochrome c biogenesis heme-transporting ATPase CcmA [Methylocaldum sp.]MVF21879.1 cytochrome c biogenesis heme-transporting ATPase CcmA [Methylocaldum sp. BRCS4]
MNDPEPTLQARGLECVRSDSLLFSDLNLSVRAGQVLQIEGPNGSGKTSLLRILAGLTPPSDGEVLWRGENIARRRSAFLSEVAYLGHQLGLKAELSVEENLRLSLALNGLSFSHESLAEALRTVGLTGREDTPARALSAGQRQRIALARLIMSSAKLWILDEPFTALDVGGVSLVETLLEAHLSCGGLAVLTSHQTVRIDRRLVKLPLA